MIFEPSLVLNILNLFPEDQFFKTCMCWHNWLDDGSSVLSFIAHVQCHFDLARLEMEFLLSRDLKTLATKAKTQQSVMHTCFAVLSLNKSNCVYFHFFKKIGKKLSLCRRP